MHIKILSRPFGSDVPSSVYIGPDPPRTLNLCNNSFSLGIPAKHKAQSSIGAHSKPCCYCCEATKRGKRLAISRSLLLFDFTRYVLPNY